MPNDTLPSVFETPYFETKIDGATYAGLEIPAELFQALGLKQGDTLRWSLLVGGDYKVTINRK
ncbi:hypothetical protein EVB91_091 [Rhizobium phage RHph_I1_18]|nr:hypothetical protein EVB91_091 [Rhizobium phage RHph_I1_18]